MNGLTKIQDGFVRWMHALVLMQPNGCSVNIWSKHTLFECKPRNQGIHLLILGAYATESRFYECSYFEQPLHARQKWNEKKVLDQIKKKVELEWDELQA